jgi:hypothetical protein
MPNQEAYLSDLPLCNEPVELTITKTDEDGEAVHGVLRHQPERA